MMLVSTLLQKQQLLSSIYKFHVRNKIYTYLILGYSSWQRHLGIFRKNMPRNNLKKIIMTSNTAPKQDQTIPTHGPEIKHLLRCKQQWKVIEFGLAIKPRPGHSRPEPFSAPEPVRREPYTGNVGWSLGWMLSTIRVQGTSSADRTHKVSCRAAS